MQRSKALQIYMKPGLREDDLMLRVWEACRRHSRPQDVFRSMLRAGLRAMVESGELSEDVIAECGLDAIFERSRLRAARRQQLSHEFVAPPLPGAPPGPSFPGAGYASLYQPPPAYPPAASTAHPTPPAAREPPVASRPTTSPPAPDGEAGAGHAVEADAPGPAKPDEADANGRRGTPDPKRIGKLM